LVSFGSRWDVRVIATLLAAVTVSGCFSFKHKPKAPAAGQVDADKFLYEKGTALLAKKNWITSREYFKRLVDGYPQSTYRADAKLGIGDAYLGEGRADSLVLAVNEFREYLQYYPTSERADYAQYRLALGQSKQMLTAERDQTATRDALVEIKRFIDAYPDSKYRPEVDKLFRQARDRLSESEYKVARLYYSGKWYPGALARFSEIVKDDPAYSKMDEVYFYMGEALMKAGAGPQALPMYERLLAEYPKSKFAKTARIRVATLKKTGPGGRP
jgi:outer membrane protein assembly factor BamD